MMMETVKQIFNEKLDNMDFTVIATKQNNLYIFPRVSLSVFDLIGGCIEYRTSANFSSVKFEDLSTEVQFFLNMHCLDAHQPLNCIYFSLTSDKTGKVMQKFISN